MKWRTKPVEVEAFRLGWDPMPRWYTEMVNRDKAADYHDGNGMVASNVRTPDGWVVASQGDWLVKSPYSGVRVMKHVDFVEMYEVAE